MPTGLLPRVQDLELQLGDLRSRCNRLESDCRGVQEQVRQVGGTVRESFGTELRGQVEELVRQLLGEASAQQFQQQPPEQPYAPKARAGVSFRERTSAVEIPAASDLRPSKKRTPTAFVPVPASGLRFDDSQDVEEVKASSASDLRPTKSRQATCFARPSVEDEEVEEQSGRHVGFSDGGVAIEVEGSPTGRSVKGRVATTFVKDVPRGAAVSFDEQIEREEVGVESGGRPTKSRQATCFARGPPPAEEEEEASFRPGARSGVSFDEHVDKEEVGVENGAARPTKSRQATCFVRAKPEEEEERSKAVMFSKEDSVVETGGMEKAGRPVKARVATAFVPGAPADEPEEEEVQQKPKRGVMFGKRDSVVEIPGVASVAAAATRSVKQRQPTAFAQQPVEEPDRPKVAFGKEDSVVEVVGNGEAKRSVKQRQATAFAKPSFFVEDDDEPEEKQGVSFARGHADTEEVLAADGQNMRPIKSRQATAFVPRSVQVDDDDEDTKRVGFSEDTSAVEVSFTGEGRSSKHRAPTAFVAATPDPGGVRFAAQHEEQETVKSASSDMRSTKSRQATTFAAPRQAVDDDDDDDEDASPKSRGIRFRDHDSVMGLQGMAEEDVEVEIAPNAKLRPSRVRQPTAFAPPPKDHDEEEEEEDSGDESRRKRQSSISFSEKVEEHQSNHGPGATRPSRNRIPTSFVPSAKLSSISFGSVEMSDEEEEEDASPAVKRAVRTRLPTTFARAKAINYNQSNANSDDDAAVAAIMEDEVSSTPMETPRPSIEALGSGSILEALRAELSDIDLRKVPDAPKNVELIRKTLQSLYFFDNLDQQGYDALVDVMEVFEFGDKENVTVQGSTQGTHFFIVADGTLQVIRDGKILTEIATGAAFGESVILLSGAQNATVRAVGTVRVYGITGHKIRRTLRNRYHREHKDASKMINELLKAGTCSLLHNLSPYQTQCLFDKGRLLNMVCGEELMTEGDHLKAVHVCAQGQFSCSSRGKKLTPPKRFSLMGEMGVVNGKADTTVSAERPSQTLVLTTEALNDMFGEKLHESLIHSCLLGRMHQHHLFMGMSMEQLDMVADMALKVEVPPGGELRQHGVYFAICIDGAVMANDGRGAEDAELQGIVGEGIGDENLHEPWTLTVRSTQGVARLALWQNSGLAEVLKQKVLLDSAPRSGDSSPSSPSKDNLRPSLKKMGSLRMAMLQDDKESALRKVVVLRTLSTEQLQKLALALTVIHLPAGSVVFSQGEEGHDFYIIHTGQLSVLIGSKQVRTLGMGDYVGERALLFSEPRSATIEVLEDAELWKMNKESFMEVVKGPILDYMKDRIAFQNTKVELDSLKCLRIVGRGGFGVVKMVQSPATKTRYALKCVNKKAAVLQKQQKALAVERSILAELDHPFVIKFVRSFLGKHYVYFLMELVTGGELLDALDKLGLLDKAQAQFYVASIALALEFLHERRIAYLDVKGENCLIDTHGYLKIIDFGIAERLQGGRIYAVKGTPLFMAPEVILGKGYTCSADLWSLGICMYDFLAGKFPFGTDQSTNPEIFKAVLKAKLKLTKQMERDETARSFLTGLLTRDPQSRLGAGPEGYAAIKEHSYFKGFSWDGLLSRQLAPPFIPTCETYAEDQEEAAPVAPVTENPRMTSAEGMVEGGLGDDDGDDDWVDPDPSWQEHF